MAENTSTKKPRFLPDPSKWIQTAPSTSSAKKTAQRPLSAFRNAFATPTSIKRQNQNVASTQGKKQDSLTGFFTPPAASGSVVKKEHGTKPPLAKDGTGDHTKMRGSPAKGLDNGGIGHTSTITKKSRLYVRADGDSDSDLDLEQKPDMVNHPYTKKGTSNMDSHRTDQIAGQSIDAKSKSHARPRVTPLQSHRSAPVTSSSSGMSDALGDQDIHTPPRKGKRKYNRTLTSSPSPPLFDIPPAEEEEDFMPSHASSDRPITPVPDYVLDIHKRLCGRDSERMKRVKSPWRTMDHPTVDDRSVHHASPVKKRKTEREREREKVKKAIDERAHDQALFRRRNKENEGNKLVLASSQLTAEVLSPKGGKRKRGSSPVFDIPPLAPLTVNALHHTTSRGPPKDDGTPKRSARPMQGDHQAEKADDPFSPSAVYREICGHPAKTTPPRAKLRRIPTGASPGSAIPLTSPSPKRHSSSPPAKSKSSSTTEPPQASSSTEAVPSAARRRDFKPVSMQPETLVSWNGGNPAPLDSEVEKVIELPIRPEPTPVQSRAQDSSPIKVPEADSAETQSLAPSVASQSFPNIIPSPTRPIPAFFGTFTSTVKDNNATTKRASKASPNKTKVSTIMPETIHRAPTATRSIARFPTDLGVAETVLPAGTPSKDMSNSQTPRRKGRQSQSGWPATGFGLERTTPTNDKNRSGDGGGRSPTSAGSSSKKRRNSALTTHASKGTQSKLASFGFFGERPKKATKGFDEDWEQEDDLPFEGEDDENDLVKEGRAEIGNGGKKLQAVPLPPPHPALRPAGVRELRRREEQCQNLTTQDQTRSRIEHYTRPDDQDQENEIDDISMNDNEPLFPELSSSSPPRNHHRSNTSASASSTDEPHQSSSLTTEDELGMDMNASAAAWWDGLEDRRSSEFGSFVVD